MNPLAQFKRSVTSYAGEDGIIEEIFRIIGETNKWCVEFGAVDGKSGSNTWNLLKNKDWSGVLIEANPVFFSKLVREHKGNKKVHTVNAYVGFEGENTLDAILARQGAPRDIDFISIDIDGADYHVWDALTDFKPRVVMIECNLRIPTDIVFIQKRDMSVGQGSSLRALVELAKKKGYELVYAGDMNAIFVLKELYAQFGITDNSPSVLQATVENGARFFQLFDGAIVLEGVPADQMLLFKKVPRIPLYVMQGGETRPIPIVHELFFVRYIKEFIKKMPFYSRFVHPLARRVYGKSWKQKQEELRKIGKPHE